ncbi:MAG: DUF2341 domain-containing protein [Chloroflexota bacterium]|nr:DUF2341 domain-containing protein [Chloroflexota bacterium]
MFYRILHGDRSFTTAPFSAGSVGHREGPSITITWADTLHGGAIPNSSSMGGRVITVTVMINVPEDDPVVQRDLEIDLKRYVEASRATRRWKRLTIQEEPGMEAVYWEAIAGDIVPDPEEPNTWHITFHCKGVGYAETPTEIVERINPRNNLAPNPSFESITLGSSSDTFASWTQAGTGTGKADRRALFGRYSVRLTPDTSASYVGYHPTTNIAYVLGQWYVISFWYAGSGTPRIAIGGVVQVLTALGDPVKVDGLSWKRYKVNYQSDGTSVQTRFDSYGAQGRIDGVQIETAGSGAANPRNFNIPAENVEYLLHTPGGGGLIEPTLGYKPIVAPVGRYRYRLGPFKCDSPADIRMDTALCQIFEGAQAEVDAGRLQATGNDLRVVADDGRHLDRWIQRTDASGAALANWIIWFEGVEVGNTPRYIYLIYGNPTALDPARWGPPEDLRAERLLEPVSNDDPLVNNRNYYYGVACARSATGSKETLLSPLLLMTWDEKYEVRLAWDRQPNATWYLVYRGQRRPDGSAPTAKEMYLVATTQQPTWTDTGARAISSKHPRMTGSNPETPYNRRKPLWDLLLSRNDRRRQGVFYDRDYPSKPGTWKADKGRNRASFWATLKGICNVRRADSVVSGDEWEHGFPMDVIRVDGQLRVTQHPDRTRAIIQGTKGGRLFDIYKAGEQVDEPTFEVRVRNLATGESSTLAAGTYNVAVTGVTAAGDETATRYRRSVKVTKSNAQKIEVAVREAVPQTSKYRVFASRQQDPKYRQDYTTAQVGTWVGVFAEGTGPTAPKSNETVQIYWGLALLSAFSVNLTERARGLKLWLSQDKEYRPDPVQQVQIEYLMYFFDPAQAPTVENAVVPTGGPPEFPHLEVTTTFEKTGHRIRTNLIEAVVGRETVVRCEEKAISDDAQGNPQRDALEIRHIDEYWAYLVPRETNVIRVQIHARSDYTGNQDLDFRLWYRKRFP